MTPQFIFLLFFSFAFGQYNFGGLLLQTCRDVSDASNVNIRVSNMETNTIVGNEVFVQDRVIGNTMTSHMDIPTKTFTVGFTDSSAFPYGGWILTYTYSMSTFTRTRTCSNRDYAATVYLHSFATPKLY
jgi:hypothetical protein